MKYNAEFISTTSDDASKSIQNYFSARDPELRERYHIVESRLPLLEFPEKIFGFSPETLIIFLSRHSSKAKVNSITVHPVGNFSSNDVGGVQRDIAISCPEIQSSVLRKMNETYHGDRYQITFQATHHGPQSNNPIIFAEIGTEEENWKDPVALETLFVGVTEAVPQNFGNFVGVGGGHYAPKISSYAIKNEINIGHIISKFRMDEIGKEEIEMSIRKTPECKGFVVDKKGVKSKGMGEVKEIADRLGLEVIII